jgi:hypothetical protein
MMDGGKQTQRIFRKIVSDQIGLEKGTHLSISRSRMVEDQEMNLERSHEDQNRDNDEAKYTSTPVFRLLSLRENVI